MNKINAIENSIKPNKPELLAPAGNPATFYAVLRAGADAVYLAGNKFGARAYADNFSQEEICACIKYAHLYNKRVYMTVNTLLTNIEIAELYNFLNPMYMAGLDGVIIQDIGVIDYLKNTFPGMELHASTQLNTTTAEGSQFLKDMGICRIVPARELSLQELKTIKAATGLELECFIHGAICYCYSGQCLFSSVIGGRSGNRGRCAQPCRLPYSAYGRSNIYPLSLKDMCTVEYLPELIEAGIDSFKIEGRMKKPEYAAGVTALYRKYIDQYFNKGSVSVTEKDRKILSTLYIRSEISEGYYKRHNGSEMITLNTPSYNGSDENTLTAINKDYVGDNAAKSLHKYNITGSAYFVTGEPAILSLSYNDISVTVYGDVVQSAQKKPVTAADVAKQINKLGSTVFTLDETALIEASYVSEDAYYNLKGINDLRRNAVNQLEKEIVNSYGLIYEREPALRTSAKERTADNFISDSARSFNILINDLSQLNAVKDFSDYFKNNSDKSINSEAFINRIYIPEESFDSYEQLADSISGIDVPVFIAMPYVRRMRDKTIIEKLRAVFCEDKFQRLKGILVRNTDDLHLASDFKKINPELTIATDYSLYTWNDYAINVVTKYASSVALPLELCGAAQRELSSACSEKMVYGRIPLMHTANCINKTLGKCKAQTCWTKITDRTGRVLPVFADCKHCQNTIYNAVPLTLTNELKNYSKDISFRIDFANEKISEIHNVLAYYITKSGEVTWEYTKAFEKHSTE